MTAAKRKSKALYNVYLSESHDVSRVDEVWSHGRKWEGEDMSRLERLADRIGHEDAFSFDGLDGAIIGHGSKYPEDSVLIYSAQRIIDLLMLQNGMSLEEAEEYFSFNIACLYAGEGTPIIVWECEDDD